MFFDGVQGVLQCMKKHTRYNICKGFRYLLYRMINPTKQVIVCILEIKNDTGMLQKFIRFFIDISNW